MVCKLPQKEYVLKMIKIYTPLKPTVKTVGQITVGQQGVC